MSPRDTLTAVVSATLLGLAFIAIKVGVHEAPPLFLTALRFAFAAFPALIFVRPPKAQFGWTAFYGLLIGVGQFGLLFLAIGRGMPVGLASLVIQLQAFITVFLAWAWMGERPKDAQIAGAGVALLGILAIGSQRLEGASLGPLLMVIGAAFCWGVGNLIAKLAGKIDMFAFVVWSSLAAPIPLVALSLIFEGERGVHAVLHPSLALVLSVAGLAYGGTVAGFGLWSRLLSLHSAAEVAPFALLIPVVGMIAGAALFHEAFSAVELLGAALVMAGLAINVFGGRLFAGRLKAAE